MIENSTSGSRRSRLHHVTTTILASGAGGGAICIDGGESHRSAGRVLGGDAVPEAFREQEESEQAVYRWLLATSCNPALASCKTKQQTLASTDKVFMEQNTPSFMFLQVRIGKVS